MGRRVTCILYTYVPGGLARKRVEKKNREHGIASFELKGSNIESIRKIDVEKKNSSHSLFPEAITTSFLDLLILTFSYIYV